MNLQSLIGQASSRFNRPSAGIVRRFDAARGEARQAVEQIAEHCTHPIEGTVLPTLAKQGHRRCHKHATDCNCTAVRSRPRCGHKFPCLRVACWSECGCVCVCECVTPLPSAYCRAGCGLLCSSSRWYHPTDSFTQNRSLHPCCAFDYSHCLYVCRQIPFDSISTAGLPECS